ncbi:hypothetical protein P4637_01340 [Halalkalibacterium halodurans]|jgi:hypothetical protein|uniref:BH1784 protein n=2 Tax=Halalkalibacterium halodurans TaxID=86665 RepID=Q9KBZ0_HALH5|nr:hypothetical protein [Halalkalibacterium halodurans]MDY7222344.1 hypothetical protein [Halalkalibacterium halodurans]MDY7241565.1 hypothetical protein [Halalkalibacterium halodurans]MED3646349.1 hypothetical protein [Halalkalibacterium halodurans]MED4082349.1 hypothetical protein [Halalkalibacterium halodurans]MED4083500.1 hypothetical protein [Halalkalibacterium halodurans]
MDAREQLTDWLEAHKDQKLMISKQEYATGMASITDSDQVSMTLEAVTFIDSENRDLDGYVANHELVLHGEGSIQGSEHATGPLPDHRFDIQLEDGMTISADGNQLIVETSRAKYFLEAEV